MKKMMIVVATVALAFAACGKKKDAATPATPDNGSATAPAGSDAAGSGAADGSAAPAPGM